MDIRTIVDAYRFSSQKMQKVNLFATPELFLDVYCLEPGQRQKVHAHDASSKYYLVLEGRGTFHVNEESKELGAGQVVLAPAGALHGVENRATERLVVLVGMAPPPSHA